MHIVWDTRTGDVLDGPVTGGGWGPDGIPLESALVNVPEADRDHAAVLRLADDDPEVARILTLATAHHLHVADGQVVAGDPLPPVEEPEPEPDPLDQLRAENAELRSALDQIIVDLLEP